MACGKKPARKLWVHPKEIKSVIPSKYEKNEASVKEHWKDVVTKLESSYKDSRFWETTGDQVHELVGDVMFERLRKIFHLPAPPPNYQMKDKASTVVSSAEYYVSTKMEIADTMRNAYSMSDLTQEEHEQEEYENEDDEMWSLSTEIDKTSAQRILSLTKSMTKSVRSLAKSSRLYAKSRSSEHKISSKNSMSKSGSNKSKSQRSLASKSFNETASSRDDILVHAGDFHRPKRRRHLIRNPYYEMLYCNDSETDMIKWKSNYKQKKMEISASDEFSKRAEIKTKMIASEFYKWWVDLGSNEFKSEIKKPEDIESLFQVWFDEHASHGLSLDPRILPCVLRSIAEYVGVPENSCPNVLKKQILWDIDAETAPAHKVAFNSSLSAKLRQIPPKNNTKESWHCVKIPEDLRSMACIWGEIQHLTSTKSFLVWLRRRPNLPVPPILQHDRDINEKHLFVVPSDLVEREGSGSEINLAIPFSHINLQLKDVLSKLMNQ